MKRISTSKVKRLARQSRSDARSVDRSARKIEREAQRLKRKLR